MGKCCLFLQFISCSDYYGRLFVCKHLGDYLDLGCRSLSYLPFIWSLEMGHWNLQQSDFYVSGRQQRSGFWLVTRQAALTGAYLNFKLDEMLLWKSATRLFSLYIASALSPVFVSICLSFNSRLGVEWRIPIHSHPFLVPGW